MKVQELFKKPYIYWIISIFLIYLVLNIFISGFYQSIPLILLYFKSVIWVKLILSLILTLAIGILVSINAVYSYVLYKQRKSCKKGATLGGLGTLGGLSAGVCPICITGLLPLIFSVFGLSFSFASLPFGGIEIQIAVLIVLLISLKSLSGK